MLAVHECEAWILRDGTWRGGQPGAGSDWTNTVARPTARLSTRAHRRTATPSPTSTLRTITFVPLPYAISLPSGLAPSTTATPRSTDGCGTSKPGRGPYSSGFADEDMTAVMTCATETGSVVEVSAELISAQLSPQRALQHNAFVMDAALEAAREALTADLLAKFDKYSADVRGEKLMSECGTAP